MTDPFPRSYPILPDEHQIISLVKLIERCRRATIEPLTIQTCDELLKWLQAASLTRRNVDGRMDEFLKPPVANATPDPVAKSVAPVANEESVAKGRPPSDIPSPSTLRSRRLRDARKAAAQKIINGPTS